MVRVFDSKTEEYFWSEVYAVINTGWYEKQLVRVPCSDGEYFEFYDRWDKSTTPAKVLINEITHQTPSEWVA